MFEPLNKTKKHKYEAPESKSSYTFIDDGISETSSKVKSNKYSNVQSRLYEKPKAFIQKEQQHKEMVIK